MPLPLSAPGQPDDRRGSIQAELAFLLRLHLKRGAVSGRIVTNAGVVPELWADRRTRMVDVAVTFAAPSAEPETPEPVVVIGIASAATEAAIRETLSACMTIPSAKEALLVSSVAAGAEIFRRGEDGAWSEPEFVRRGGRLVIDSIGFDRRLEDIYDTTDLKG